MRIDYPRFARVFLEQSRQLARQTESDATGPHDLVEIAPATVDEPALLARQVQQALSSTASLAVAGIPVPMAAAVLAVQDQWGPEVFSELGDQRHEALSFNLEGDATDRTQRLRKMGQAITQAGGLPEGRFYVAHEEALHYEPASTRPGGRVYASDSFIDQASDEALAFTLGHELGHVDQPGDAAGMVAGTALEKVLKLGGLKAEAAAVEGLYKDWKEAIEKRADRAGTGAVLKLGLDPWKAYDDVTSQVRLGKERELALQAHIAEVFRAR
ncbi:MAG: M48 family metalloprotease [Vulcanimicrobiota bacterium]